MPSFNVATRGKISATIQLPGSSEPFNACILESAGYIPDKNRNSTDRTVSKQLDKDYGLRHIISWTWKNDPLFKVRYKYQ